MSQEMHKRVLDACLQWLLPISRVLLQHGIGYKEFDELCRRAFVQSATRGFGVRGRETNTSRVSAMTGISRKEVQRLKRVQSSDQREETEARLSPLADLLHVWATDADLQDAHGQPAVLPSGSQGAFADLVRRCIGDVPPGAVRAELVRLGVVEQTKENRLRLVRRSLIPSDVHERLASAFVYSIRGLAETVAHNNNPKTSPSELWFERFVESAPLSDSQVAEIRNLLRDRLKQVSEELDDLMSTGSSSSHGGRRLGVGLYYTE